MENVKTGIVVEGGGLRGIYAAGALDVFLEQNVHVDGVIGVSAGAINGCSFVAGQRGRSIRYNLKFCRDPRYMSLRSWIKNGDILDPEFCYHELPEILDPFDNETFEASDTEFYVTCTDVETGKPVYHHCPSLRGDQIDWVRASASMPLASKIVEIEGQKLMDGGVSDSIPVGAFRKMGFSRNIVILTRPEGYRKKPNSMMPLMKKVYRKYPKFLETSRWRYLAYNRELEEIKRQQEAGEILVIKPSRCVKIQRTERNPEKIRQMYELGRMDGTRMIEEVKEFLNLS